MLTIGRVLAVPLLIPLFYHPASWSGVTSAAVFVIAALTDWLDGYLARKMKLMSAFGAFLDPVADKLMVAASLLLLCTFPPTAGPGAAYRWLTAVASIAIIGREIAMSALREWAATASPEAREAVAVSSLGKIKTAAQMVAITLLLLTRDGSFGGGAGFLALAGYVLLYVAAALSLWSLFEYIRCVWDFLAPSSPKK
eukprot:jgi/Mesvir1/14453/Mv11501-RA.1